MFFLVIQTARSNVHRKQTLMMKQDVFDWALSRSEKCRRMKKLKIARNRHTEHGVPEECITKGCMTLGKPQAAALSVVGFRCNPPIKVI